MKSARQITAEALLRVERSQSWSNLTLDSAVHAGTLDARDEAFVGALFYGVLERLITLDTCIAAHARQKPADLTDTVRIILRMTVYQLLYMDSVPDYAAVDEAVELARKMRAARAAGFINAVLRAFIKGGKRVPAPRLPLEKRLSIEFSVGQALIRLWLDSYGYDKTLEILRASLGRPPVYIRTNTLKTTRDKLLAQLREEGVTAVADDMLPECIVLSGQGALGRLSSFMQGLFHVQDKSSQLCCLALEAGPGMRVLDTCAAPGGKSFTLAQIMEGRGELVSAELHEQRAARMAEQAIVMWANNMKVVHADMGKEHPGLGKFDRVLCDVPCSGFGVIRRKPEIRYKDLEDFSHIANIQYKILSAASQYCKEGARLIYSTCTLNPAENEAVAARFLEEYKAFAPAPLPDVLGGAPERTLTGEFGGDCFFMAAFERKI
ncbi:MAG: 16S rRNA (cytosine(967)-C(5))-methyltransferase RsmB [Oscillospiraceae bacterium]|nr:16S rRNA (cytosine(967)-C(5))-methyltransferase RsmB [Oscillospiraceae bacterium]